MISAKDLLALTDGCKIRIEKDPEDPRFELMTVRYVSNEVVGGPPVPLCDLTGRRAHNRWMRLLLARSAGVVQQAMPGKQKVIEVLHKIRAKYDDREN